MLPCLGPFPFFSFFFGHDNFLPKTQLKIYFLLFSTFRIYSTRIQLGSPSRDFYVQIDTGSNIFWVGCTCQDCPSTTFVVSNISIVLWFLTHFVHTLLSFGFMQNSPRSYNPQSSSTAHAVGCTDRRCPTRCSAPDDLCRYKIQYIDHSSTSGYYVLDLLHFETTLANSETVNTTAPVVFG